ncbi:unnamed protein product [Ophioblennius macclurei]
MDGSSRLSLPSESPEVFRWGDRAVEVLQAFSQLRQQGRFCDVELVVGGRRMAAHRALLAGSCPYFDAMFTSGMKEEQQLEVEMGGVSFEGLKAVVDFLYSGELQLDGGNISGVLEAAHLLQVLHAVDFCSQYLEQQVNEDTYLCLQELARFYNLERLDNFIDDFVLTRFATLSLTPDFLQCTPLNKITSYLCSGQVQHDSEEALLTAALRWLAQTPERTAHAGQLLSNIRFPLIPEADLVSRALPAVRTQLPDVACSYQELVEEALEYHRRSSAQPVLQSKRTEMRGGVERLLLAGGEVFERAHWLNFFMTRLEAPPGVWEVETHMPVERSHHSLAVLGGFVFIAGGCTSRFDWRNKTCNLLHRYDPRHLVWTECAPMERKRSEFFLGVVGDRLIAVAGRDDFGPLSTAEVYKPAEDTWDLVSGLPNKCVYGHGGTVHDGIVYISGGQNSMEGVYRADFLRYDPSRDADGWAELQPMGVARSWHCMASVGHLIFAIGGSTNSEDLSDHRDTLQVESYDVRHGQWTRVAPLLQPKCEASAVVWHGKVHVLGGYSWESEEFFNSVQVYDPEARRWSAGPDLLHCIAGTTACVCTVKRADAPERRRVEEPDRRSRNC